MWREREREKREREGEKEIERENYEHVISIKNNYLLGHVRALYPGCRHAPQSRDRLAGGSSVAVVVVVEVAPAVVVVRRGVDEGLELGGGVADGDREGDESSGGAAGRGHVMSFKFSGQNSLILWNKYHCRWLERPDGGRTGGS